VRASIVASIRLDWAEARVMDTTSIVVSMEMS